MDRVELVEGLEVLMRWLVLAMLLVAATAEAQTTTKVCATDLPCIPGEFGKMVHAGSHAVLAIGVAESLRLLDKDWNVRDRYLVATVAVPVVWEVFDWWQFQRFRGQPPRSSVYDLLSYQGAWILPLLREGRYWQAALVFVAWAGSVVVWELN